MKDLTSNLSPKTAAGWFTQRVQDAMAPRGFRNTTLGKRVATHNLSRRSHSRFGCFYNLGVLFCGFPYEKSSTTRDLYEGGSMIWVLNQKLDNSEAREASMSYYTIICDSARLRDGKKSKPCCLALMNEDTSNHVSRHCTSRLKV